MTFSSLNARVASALAICFGVIGLLTLFLPAPVFGKRPEISPTVVISQVYGGAGCVPAGCSAYKNDYIEIFNRGATNVSLHGWSVQYASATSTSWSVTTLPNVVLASAEYLLVQEAGNANGINSLPAPDVIGTISMNTVMGKVALVTSTAALSGACPTSASILDFVGYGATANCNETANGEATSATTALIRVDNGCTDTDNNSADFAAGSPNPRDTLSPTHSCSAPTLTATVTVTVTQTNTATPTTTDTSTATYSATATAIPASKTPTSTLTDTQTPTQTETPDDALTTTPTFTESSTATSTPTFTPSATPTSTLTSTLTATPTETPSNTVTATPTESPTDTVTLTPTDVPTDTDTPTETLTSTITPTPLPPSHLVLSQIFGAGGNSDALYQNDFIEIFNPGMVGVNLNGWSVQYTAATGTSWSVTVLPDADLAQGQYFLIQEGSAGAHGARLPLPDATGSIAMSTTAGKVALVNGITALGGACPTNASMVDFVGYGSTPNCSETAPIGVNLGGSTAAIRKDNGCRDTDDNLADFVLPLGVPIPRDTASPFNYCQSTATPTETVTATVTWTPTDALTDSLTPTPTDTPTYFLTNVDTETPTASPTNTQTETPTESPTNTETATPMLPSHLVISQIYGAGGNSDALYQNDFIEIFNADAVSVNLDGWSVQYTSATGTSWNVTALPNIDLAPGQYFLIQEASAGAHGALLPLPDAIGTIAMSTTAGKVALLSQTIALSGACPTNIAIADFVGYGSSPNCYETSPTGANLSGSAAARRQADGCVDTNDNADDFVLPLPVPNPHNSTSPFNYCLSTATPTDTSTPTETPMQAALTTSTPTPTETPTDTETATPVLPSHLVISQIYGAGGNGDATYQNDFIEIFNADAVSVNLDGWSVQYTSATGTSWSVTALPAVSLAPGQYFLIQEASAGAHGALLPTPDAIGTIAMSTTAGKVALVNRTTPLNGACPTNRSIADFVGYGSTPNCAETTPTGVNLGGGTAALRQADGCIDTNNNAADFVAPPVAPSPRNSASPFNYCLPTATPTATPTLTLTLTETLTPTETPTVTATFTETPFPAGVVINEILPKPSQDWNADTFINSNDEWVELYNLNGASVDLSAWMLDDIADGGTSPYTFPTGTKIPAHGFLLVYKSESHLGLNDGGDEVRLLYPDVSLADSYTYTQTESDVSMSRNPDGTGAFTSDCAPSPGAFNCSAPRVFPPTNTATATVTPSSTATETATSTPAPGQLFVNEFMPNPTQDWNGDSVADENDEWIEIYNANAFAVDLSGWFLDDVANGGSAPYRLPRDTHIAPNGYLIFFRAQTHIALNQSNDDVRLLRPDGTVADSISYKSSEPNASWARVPDAADYFALYCPPTPAAPNCSIAPTPTLTPTPFAERVMVNEFLPAPYKDWNQDGVLDSGDEWIELYNASRQAVDLSGWQLDDGHGGSSAFTIPDGMMIEAHAFRVFYANETNIGLNNGGDMVRLLHPDHSVADKIKYDPLKTNQSLGRFEDGSDIWRANCVPTPGKPNCSNNPLPTPTRVFELTTISEARALPDEAHVSILGSVIAHPCELDTYGHEMTLSDGRAGLDVYLAYPNQLSCLIPRGEQLVVTGVLRDHFGMRFLYPDSNRDITRHYAPPREIAPVNVHTGKVNEATESMLVTIQGSVSNGKNGDTLWVNDGTGIVEVYADPDSHTSLGDIPHGSIVRVTGIGYQYNQNKLSNEGYYLRIRAPDDVVVLQRAEKSVAAPKRGVDLGAVSISQALETRPQNYVTVGGTVTVPPGMIGARDFWIQDAEGGVHVFVAASAGLAPKLTLAENVTVRGRVISLFGAREIRVELPNAISQYGVGALVQPHPIQTGAAAVSKEGMLVSMAGFVSSANGREIYIDDGSGEVLVYLDATTHIHWGKLHRGDPARIMGVLSRFHGEPEILPRFQSDVQFGVMLLPVTGAPEPTFLQTLHVHARIGKASEHSRRMRANASFRIAHTPSTRDAAPLRVPIENFITLISMVFVAVSFVLGIVAARLYRAGGEGSKQEGKSGETIGT